MSTESPLAGCRRLYHLTRPPSGHVTIIKSLIHPVSIIVLSSLSHPRRRFESTYHVQSRPSSERASRESRHPSTSPSHTSPLKSSPVPFFFSRTTPYPAHHHRAATMRWIHCTRVLLLCMWSQSKIYYMLRAQVPEIFAPAQSRNELATYIIYQCRH